MVPLELIVLGFGVTLRVFTIYKAWVWRNLSENESPLAENEEGAAPDVENANVNVEVKETTDVQEVKISPDNESVITADIGGFVKKTGEDISGFVKKTGEDFSGFVKKTGDDIGNFAKKTGENFAIKTGQGILKNITNNETVQSFGGNASPNFKRSGSVDYESRGSGNSKKNSSGKKSSLSKSPSRNNNLVPMSATG